MDSWGAGEWVLLVSVFLLFWIYAGYPAILFFIPGRKRLAVTASSVELPSVSVIVPCWNEALSIERKLQNLEALDYPKDRIEVIVADAGSPDGTADVARAHHPAVRVVVMSRIGKARTISHVLPLTKGEIVVVTDANAWMEPDAIRLVAESFSDRAVGAATGAMRQRDDSGVSVSEGSDVYWRLEAYLRVRESRIHSVVGVSGEIAAFRRSIFVQDDGSVVDWYPPGTPDDMQLSNFVVRHGFRIRYVADAHVWEYAPSTIRDFFGQRVRNATMTIVSVRHSLSLIWSTGWYGFIFFSRRALPILSPWLLVVTLIVSLILSTRAWLAATLLIAQLICYLLGLLAFGPASRWSVARMLNFFLLLNASIALAWGNVIRGRGFVQWDPVSSTRRA